MKSDYYQAVSIIKRKGIIIYPTETFFALGGSGIDQKVAERICKIKNRLISKPLPLISGSLEQCLETVAMDGAELRLASQFWPGPLSILVRAKDKIPVGVKDSRGLVSIRVTPHPGASMLCLESGFPLIATSANFSGLPPCARVRDLDSNLTRLADHVFNCKPLPAGRLASTLVKTTGKGKLKIIRPGEISREILEKKGWSIESG